MPACSSTEPVPEGADPLASGRVTLLGLLAPVDDAGRDQARARYLDANPAASYYIDFGDFTFLRLAVDHVRYVGGYGRMSWVDAADYHAASPDPLVDAAAGIIEHMNDDHADAQVLFCRHFAHLPDTTSASMSAVDRYGFDMIAVERGAPHAGASGLPRGVHDRRRGAPGDGRDGGRGAQRPSADGAVGAASAGGPRRRSSGRNARRSASVMSR